MKYFVQTNDDWDEDPDNNVLGRDGSGELRLAGHGGPINDFGLVNSKEEAFALIQEYAATLSGFEYIITVPHELHTNKTISALDEARADFLAEDSEGHWKFVWFEGDDKVNDKFFFVYNDSDEDEFTDWNDDEV